MNTKLLRKVKKVVLEEPRRLDMANWIQTNMTALPAEERPPCGTVACIAGWAIHLSGVDPALTPGAYSEIANGLLGLDEDQGRRLYYTGSWPESFDEAYHAAETAQERAQIAARRIDHFIKTKGAE